MLSSLFFLLFGSLGLYFGSEFLIDGAKNLAKKLNVSAHWEISKRKMENIL